MGFVLIPKPTAVGVADVVVLADEPNRTPEEAVVGTVGNEVAATDGVFPKLKPPEAGCEEDVVDKPNENPLGFGRLLVLEGAAVESGVVPLKLKPDPVLGCAWVPPSKPVKYTVKYSGIPFIF